MSYEPRATSNGQFVLAFDPALERTLERRPKISISKLEASSSKLVAAKEFL
jgi:hypothetical protein